MRVPTSEAHPPRRGFIRALAHHGPLRIAGIASATVLCGVVLVLVLWAHAPQTGEAASDALEAEMSPRGTDPGGEADGMYAEDTSDGARLAVETAKRLTVHDAPSAPPAPSEDRWAAASPAPSNEAARELAEILAPDGDPPRTEATPVEPDRTLTSAIPSGETPDTASVAIAESQEEIAALEDRMAQHGADAFALISAGAHSAAADPVQANGTARQGVVTSFVNLRATPDNDAAVLRIVPEGASVGVLDHCPNWCEVDHEGVRGFIYGSYVERGEAAATLEADGL